MWTIFEYMYRDASNFKAYGTLPLDGIVTAADEQLVRNRLESEEFFIAEQIGVPALYEQLYQWSGGSRPSDHCWHEFVGFRELTTPPEGSSPPITSGEFIARFAEVKEWDEAFSPHFRIADPLWSCL